MYNMIDQGKGTKRIPYKYAALYNIHEGVYNIYVKLDIISEQLEELISILKTR